MKSYTTPIITGLYKGRKLALPEDEAVRPTRHRIRQAAFNLLESRLDFEGKTVADLCCGSGAWGLEAISRGAAHVYLVDTDTRPAAQNVRVLGLPEGQATLVRMGAENWAPATPADIIWADPPYNNTKVIPQLLAQAEKLGHSGTWWLLETATGTVVTWPHSFTERSVRPYGTTTLHLALQG